MLERHTQLTLNIVYFAVQFGHENIFRVDTRERQFYMQAISAEDMEEWLSHIKTALQVDCTPAFAILGSVLFASIMEMVPGRD